MKTSLSFLICLLFAGRLMAQPLPVVFDTDMGNDVDDALALAMLHAFDTRGEIDLLAVTVTKDNRFAAPYIDLVNTFYGRGDIPIGVVRNGVTPEDNNMIRVPAERKRSDGSYVYPHDLTDGRTAPEAVSVLRQVLSEQADTSVVLIQVGFSSNFARLLDSAPDAASPLGGRELVRRKVKQLVVMAGAFPTGKPEYNVHTDLPAAKKLFTEWPTPIVASGFEIGLDLLFPARSIQYDFDYVPDHPVAEAYHNYQKMPYDRPTWDLTAVLYAVRPDANYFDLSPPGSIRAGDDMLTHFTPDPAGKHRYLILTPEQHDRALEALIQLASEPACAAR